ncbi:MAG: MSCRAMM family adhesin SdrC [Lachnospiraceae bacterium]|nr:MSCRAMM family adhesin SdrC [Lachnospiraceae bacterium]
MIKKIIRLSALIFIVLCTGCGLRARIPEEYNTNNHVSDVPEDTENKTEEVADPDAEHINDPNADNKEYADGKDAELTEDTSDVIADLTQNQEEDGPEPADNDADAIITDSPDADYVVTVETPSDTAEDYGIDKNADAAESAVVYYQTLLKKLDSNLFECEKYYVYMELEEDYLTIHKSSDEHAIILQAASYDVSAKLQESALNVNDGWVFRKNPGAIVKFVSENILGEGISDTSAADAVINSLKARENWKDIDAVKQNNVIIMSEALLESDCGKFAAALYIAKMLYADELQEVNPEEAHKIISEELGTQYKGGIYAYKR